MLIIDCLGRFISIDVATLSLTSLRDLILPSVDYFFRLRNAYRQAQQVTEAHSSASPSEIISRLRALTMGSPDVEADWHSGGCDGGVVADVSFFRGTTVALADTGTTG